jgi:membrane protein YdbS with pleckstrin-like domain
MKALTEREAMWMCDTKKILHLHVFTLALLGAIAITTRNYFVREMLIFFVVFVTLFAVSFFIINLYILLRELWRRGSSRVISGIREISSSRHGRLSLIQKITHSNSRR